MSLRLEGEEEEEDWADRVAHDSSIPTARPSSDYSVSMARQLSLSSPLIFFYTQDDEHDYDYSHRTVHSAVSNKQWRTNRAIKEEEKGTGKKKTKQVSHAHAAVQCGALSLFNKKKISKWKTTSKV